jgi:hypothetical protein
MAQNREHIYIAAPGFKGLNTQDSPVAQDATFAAIAENVVIDKFGRIGSRKGLDKLTTSATPLGSSDGIETVFEFVDQSGDIAVFSTGNNKIFSGTTTLTDITPAAYTVSANNWKIVNFNNHAYFFQRGQEPLIYTDESGSGVLEKFSDHSHATGTPPYANEALAAFGRIWAADVTGNKYTLYWSDLLAGHAWTGGSSGSLDLTTVWPTGYDEIVALSEFNDLLVIFGKRSILLYSGASSPSKMVLADVITNIGCIARDSVQSTGTDLLFLSDSGVRSLGRVIQEKSNPIGDVSINVRDELVQAVAVETGNIKSVYSEENAFYLLILPEVNNIVFCFDVRGKLENGGNRVTTWPFTGILCGTTTDDNKIYFGNSKGINEYSGFLDDGSTYTMKYYTHSLSFGDASRLKLLKEITFTIVGGQGTSLLLNWGYDYTEGYTKQLLTVDDASIAEYGVSEYNVETSQYNFSIVVNKATTKATGSGRVVTIGLDATINGKAFSIQDVNIEAFIGRTI